MLARNLGFACRILGFSSDYGFSLVSSGFSDFGGENPLTDPPVMGSGGGDPPPTITSVGSAGTRARSDDFYWWVGYLFSVDSPNVNSKRERVYYNQPHSHILIGLADFVFV